MLNLARFQLIEIILWSFGISSASCILDICSVHSCLARACSCVMPVSSLSNVLVEYEDNLSRGSESQILGNVACIFSGMLKNRRGRVKPVEEAKCFVRQQKDKPGLEAMTVDEYIGI